MKKHKIIFWAATVVAEKEICHQLAAIIDTELPEAESKIWHTPPCRKH